MRDSDRGPLSSHGARNAPARSFRPQRRQGFPQGTKMSRIVLMQELLPHHDRLDHGFSAWAACEAQSDSTGPKRTDRESTCSSLIKVSNFVPSAGFAPGESPAINRLSVDAH